VGYVPVPSPKPRPRNEIQELSSQCNLFSRVAFTVFKVAIRRRRSLPGRELSRPPLAEQPAVLIVFKVVEISGRRGRHHCHWRGRVGSSMCRHLPRVFLAVLELVHRLTRRQDNGAARRRVRTRVDDEPVRCGWRERERWAKRRFVRVIGGGAGRLVLRVGAGFVHRRGRLHAWSNINKPGI